MKKVSCCIVEVYAAEKERERERKRDHGQKIWHISGYKIVCVCFVERNQKIKRNIKSLFSAQSNTTYK